MDINSIYKDIEEIHTLILKHRVPLSIFKEIEKCVKRTDKIRKHKLNFLLEHHNYGSNSYQVSVPFDCIEGSFFQAYLIYLGEWFRCKYEKLSFEETRRTVRMRKNEHHFDGYDVWVNYTEKGSINKMHDHGGNLSGVIYYTDCKGSPIFFENGFSYSPKKGDILIFPSNFKHGVHTHNKKETRISLAYNLYFM